MILFSLRRLGSASWRQYTCLCLAVIVLSILLTSCSGLSLGGGMAPSAIQRGTASTTIALSRLHWCDKPVMIFRNLAASGTPGIATASPTPISDWTQVKPLLGFSVYLPMTLQNGTCLVSASATVRDPVLGSNFVIGYILPDHTSITFSQAPQRTQSTTFQCSLTTDASGPATPSSATQEPVQFCSGVRGTTNIVFSARGKTDTLQKFFSALQPDVNWVPA